MWNPKPGVKGDTEGWVEHKGLLQPRLLLFSPVSMEISVFLTN